MLLFIIVCLFISPIDEERNKKVEKANTLLVKKQKEVIKNKKEKGINY